ncbi:MAG: hypothetical protein QFX36_08990 [Archaeoglobales archaeon]|nr:hypothetical protein [Archaeoglobales archaeon]
MLGGSPSEKRAPPGRTKKEAKAYIEAEKARKKYYEVRTRVLESLERELKDDKNDEDNENNKNEE